MLDALLGALTLAALTPTSSRDFSQRIPPIVRPAVAVPQKRDVRRVGIETTGRTSFVADVASGKVLYAKKAHDVVPIASLTKLMTAMVATDAHRDDEEWLTFTEEDVETGEGKIVFPSGESIRRIDAMRALLVGSVNSAGALLARTTSGTKEFVAAMNRKAETLRLASPVFVEPTGLDPRNRANAADVAAMLSIAMTYPELRQITLLPEVVVMGKSGKEYRIKSTNLLLTSFVNKAPYRIIGAKTGSLPEAGFCMAQITRDAQGHEIVVVNLGSDNHFSRFQDVKALTAWTFNAYAWPKP